MVAALCPDAPWALSPSLSHRRTGSFIYEEFLTTGGTGGWWVLRPLASDPVFFCAGDHGELFACSCGSMTAPAHSSPPLRPCAPAPQTSRCTLWGHAMRTLRLVSPPWWTARWCAPQTARSSASRCCSRLRWVGAGGEVGVLAGWAARNALGAVGFAMLQQPTVEHCIHCCASRMRTLPPTSPSHAPPPHAGKGDCSHGGAGLWAARVRL